LTPLFHDPFISKINNQYAAFQLALPSEAQWEYACRADTHSDNYAGDESALDDIAWYDNNSENTTHPVALKQPNPWGLYDSIGNVREWTEDHYHSDYNQAPDNGQAWLDADKKVGAPRVQRGGSWGDSAANCRSAVRGYWGPGDRSNVGFRCVGLFARVQA